MTLTHNPKAAADQARAAYRKTTDHLGHLGLDTALPEAVRALAEKAVAQTRAASYRSWDAFDASLTTFEKDLRRCRPRCSRLQPQVCRPRPAQCRREPTWLRIGRARIIPGSDARPSGTV